MVTIYSIVNQKGGVGKTTTSVNLGIGLAKHNKKVLLIDADPQGSLTASLGHQEPDKIEVTLTTILGKILIDEEIPEKEGIIHHEEGIDLIPSNIQLSGIEMNLVSAISRETVLKRYINTIKSFYDYIIIDCMPSLGMITVNALTSSDSVIIPVQAQYLALKGLEQLLKTINKIHHAINSDLKINGILLTMVDSRTIYCREIIELLKNIYGSKLNIYTEPIPFSVRAAECSAEGKSIYKHNPNGKVAKAYEILTEEVLKFEK